MAAAANQTRTIGLRHASAEQIETSLSQGQAELDQLTQKIISAGLASWSGGESNDRQLIVRGHANLLEDLHALDDLERVRLLFVGLTRARKELVITWNSGRQGDAHPAFPLVAVASFWEQEAGGK